MKIDVSVSIVSYNTKDLLARCIKSVLKNTKTINVEIIVIDNASIDGSCEMVEKKFPKVKLIKNKENKYYGGANNQGLEAASGKYFLILNADTYFVDNSIKKIIDFMKKNKKVGAVEGLEVYTNGSMVITGSLFSSPLIDFYELSFIGKRFKDQKLIDGYRLTSYGRDDTFEVDVGCDAFLCVRTDILRKIKGYDEKLLLFYTENDLCLRIKKKGYKIVHLGRAKVIHEVSFSTKKIGWRKLDIYYKDLLNYYIKNGNLGWGTALFLLLKAEELLLKMFRPDTVK